MEKTEGTDSPLEATILAEIGVHPRPVVRPKQMVDQSEMGLGRDTTADIIELISQQQRKGWGSFKGNALEGERKER